MTRLEKISDLVIRVAKNEILPRFKNLKEEDIRCKSPGDMITIADIETENILSQKLKTIFPKSVVAGEESIAKSPDLLQKIISADQAFLIDPIDGTNNFIKGDPRFALMLTELRRGEAVAAWVYLPMSDKLAVAEVGSGAYVGARAIKINPQTIDTSMMIGAAHLNRFPEDLRNIARENIKKIKQNRPAFCAGYDYISLIEEKKDFSAYYRTLPWDHLPGSLIFSEAGGYVRTLINEQEYTIHDVNNGLLSATDKDQWHHIRELIFPNYF